MLGNVKGRKFMEKNNNNKVIEIQLANLAGYEPRKQLGWNKPEARDLFNLF